MSAPASGGTDNSGLTILTGSGHESLADDVAAYLGLTVVPVAIQRFPDTEISIVLGGPVRGRQAVIVQPTGPPVDTNLMELLAIADACRRAAADRIVAVVPYFGYARGDRRGGVASPLMASLVARLLETAGIDHLVTVDLHAPQIEGFFEIPVDELAAFPLLLAAVRESLPAEVVVVSPDLGRLGLAALYADHLGTTAAAVHKRRGSGGESRVLQVAGDVAGRPCLIVDDMISTGGTIAACAAALVRAGAKPDFTVVATHGLFVAGANERLAGQSIRSIWVTDTLPQPPNRLPERNVVPVASLIGEALSKL